MAERDRTGQRLLAVTEEELQRVVLDIHDGPIQTLFAALGQLSLLHTRVKAAPGGARVLTTIELIQSLLESSLGDISNIVTTLRSPVFASRSIAEIAEELVVQHETLSGGTVAFVAEALPTVSTLAKVALYRVLQEALSNIRRHAASESAVIRLSASDGYVQLDIEDTGRGFEPPPLVGPDATERTQHIGLRGMRERAAMVGGELNVDSRPGAGTRVTVRVPCEHDAGEAG